MYKILTVTLHGGNFKGEVCLDTYDSGLIWAIHNPLKSWTLYNLSEKDLRLIVLSLSENEIRLAKVCKKFESEWQNLDKNTHAFIFSENETEISFKDKSNYPPLEAFSGTVTGAATSDTGYFVIKPNKAQHPRLHERHDIVVPCVLIGNNNKQFHTDTIDLSEGGLHFKNSVPAWIAGYFIVVVNSKFQLMCSLVEDQKEKKRVQIVSEDSDFNYIQYKNWLGTF